MNIQEWYDNFYCPKCKQIVHESWIYPKHECIKEKQDVMKHSEGDER